MQVDPYVRLALGVIALALVGLLAAAAVFLAMDRGAGRYELTTYTGRRQGSWLLRLDRETGQVWRIHFPAIRSGWEPLPERAEPPAAGAEGEAGSDVPRSGPREADAERR